MADDADGVASAGPGPASREALLAQFKAADTSPTDSQAAAPSPSPPPSPAGEQPPASPDEAADADPDDDADDALVDDEADTLDAKDAKGHQAVKRAEVRMRQDLAAERAKMEGEFNAAIERVRPQLERLEKLERLVQRGRFDTDAVIELLGLTEDDFDGHGKNFLARTKAYADKPGVKEHAARTLREREERAARDAITRRQDELEATIKSEREQAANAAAKAKWMAGIKPLVDDKAPLTKRLLTKNPEKAERLIASTALDMWEKSGKQPTDKAIIAELEKRRAGHRAEFVDDEPVAADKKTDKAAAKPTNGANGAPKFKTREEALEAFRAGRLD